MQQLRELKLIGNSSELENFVERIETSLCDGMKDGLKIKLINFQENIALVKTY